MTEQHIVKILSIIPVARNVRSYRVEKPQGYTFVPGQATEVAINKPGWKGEKRPFTFTSLAHDRFLEFTIKSYGDHEGVTNELSRAVVGDSLIIHDVWGAISYQGPGYFIAGGAGITPFIAIFRQLHMEGQLSGNKLFFSNKTAADIILEKELKDMLGKDAVFILSDVNGPINSGYIRGHIDAAFLKQHVDDFGKHFYICGPDAMVKDINAIAAQLGAKPDAVVFEK